MQKRPQKQIVAEKEWQRFFVCTMFELAVMFACKPQENVDN